MFYVLAAVFVLGFVLLAVLVLVFQLLSARVQTISQISALTERVEFVVAQPGLAAIPVRQMRIATGEPALDGRCTEGLILPAFHANVIYGRVGYGPLSIRIVPPDAPSGNPSAGNFQPTAGGRTFALPGGAYLETDSACGQGSSKEQVSARLPQDIPLPMPIWGRAKIGPEYTGVESSNPEPRLLLSGQMKVSAKAVEIAPGFLDLRATLYPVTVLDLPVGSRLETYPSQPKSPPTAGKPDKDGAPSEPNWWGTAYADSQKPALNLELATDTPKLALYRPNGHEPDVVEVSRMNQIFEDPNLIKLYKLLGAFAIAAAVLKWLVEMSREMARPTKEPETK
jgi:hypothetical protein